MDIFWNYTLLADLFLLNLLIIIFPCHLSRVNKYVAIMTQNSEVLIFKIL